MIVCQVACARVCVRVWVCGCVGVRARASRFPATLTAVLANVLPLSLF